MARSREGGRRQEVVSLGSTALMPQERRGAKMSFGELLMKRIT